MSTPSESTHSGSRELTGLGSAINVPTTGNTFAAYLAAAKAIGSNEAPVRSTVLFAGSAGHSCLVQFAGSRQWPGDWWCERGCDRSACRHGHDGLGDTNVVQIVRGSPCCQWRRRTHRRSIWYHVDVRMRSPWSEKKLSFSYRNMGNV